MGKRYVAIWYRHLLTDWITRRQPVLKDVPFVMAAPERGRMIVKAANPIAKKEGIDVNMVVADCRAVLPTLQVFDYKEGLAEQLLTALAEWCIRFTPIAAIDQPDGLILDATGCTHLWKGEQPYLDDICKRMRGFGYDVRVAMADTIGAAWAMARYGQHQMIPTGGHTEALLPLPPAALRLDTTIVARLHKLGLYHVRSFINMQRKALRRRFGQELLTRIDQAFEQEIEVINPVCPIEPYCERLPSLEPIRTATGIEIALKQLLEQLCLRFAKEEKGLRQCIFKCYRIDGNIQQIEIGTNRASRNAEHLFKLFEIRIQQIEPDLGIELFILDAPVVEDLLSKQDAFWNDTTTDISAVAELLDKIAGKLGMQTIHRYLPAEHYWPERSYKQATSLQEQATTEWRTDLPRPLHLLSEPELIDVTVAIPDYPPVLFNYKGNVYRIKKADGPERVEQEWWLQKGLYRDYYCVEDEGGARYWLFRLGHYYNSEPKWFLHGFFA